MTFWGLNVLTVLICLAFNAHAGSMPSYDHVIVIIAENKNFEQIIGSADAPRLNRLAKDYGLATNFYAEVHPSEGNYIAMLGGSTFGVHDDDAWYCTPLKIDRYCPHAMLPDYEAHSIQDRKSVV